MIFLLTNDDGIDADGLLALHDAARSLGQTTIVAPCNAHSGCSHRVTLDDPIRLEARDELRYALAGTPADCVRVGLHRVAANADWVLSGINHGGNLGADVHYSGTVAAVREAAMHGKPGIAFSQYRRKGGAFDWSAASTWVAAVLQDLVARPCAPGTFWSVNLPDVDRTLGIPEIVYCPVDISPLPLVYRDHDNGLLYGGDYHNRPRARGSDIDVCFEGKIAVSQLALSFL